jgi:hypothetical protein
VAGQTVAVVAQQRPVKFGEPFGAVLEVAQDGVADRRRALRRGVAPVSMIWAAATASPCPAARRRTTIHPASSAETGAPYTWSVTPMIGDGRDDEYDVAPPSTPAALRDSLEFRLRLSLRRERGFRVAPLRLR